MRKILFIQCMLMLLFISGVYAQSKTVTGKVVDASNNLGLPGVTVVVKGTQSGASTDVNGNYSVAVPNGGTTLVFSFIGYGTVERPIGNASSLNVSLTVDARQLNEVVVTGYGVQEKREVAGAIAQINGERIQNLPNPSFDKALQGRAAGVVVQSNSGLPGGAINVQIRGIGSVNANSSPLYIIDGVQVNAGNRANFTQSNPLAQLNNNDIESIEIIKDAATAAVYGSQAANGVVIITTKKGKAGRTNITANFYTGVSQQLKKFDVLNTQEYFALRREARINAGNNETDARANIISEMGLPAAITDAEIAALPTYDFQNEAFRTGTVNNYELSASGGNEKTLFYLSGAYNQMDAIVTKADFKRGTFRANLSHKATDKLSFETNLNLSSFNQAIPFSVSGSFLGSPAFSSSLILPSNRIRNDDGTFFGLPGSGQVFGGILNQNIVAVNEFNKGNQQTNGIIGNVAVNYKILPALTFRSSYSLDYNIVQGKSYRDPRTPDAFVRRGLGLVQSDWNTNFQTVQLMTFNKVFAEKHKIDAQLGYEYRSDINEAISTSADNFPSPQFTNLSSAANPLSANEFETGYKRTSVFSTVNYVYRGKYSVRGIVSYNGSSRFGANNQFGFFPGIAAAWNIIDEPFMSGITQISNLKLRASYGQNGRDGIGNFEARALFGGGGIYSGAAGIAPSGLGNAALKWEVREMFDGGIDFAVLNNRISGTIGGFLETNKDLLFSQPLQLSTGYTDITSNVGSLKQRGIEFELNTVNVTVGDFKWRTNFNYTYIQNEISKLYDTLTILPSNPAIRVGQDIGTIFTQRYAGVNPATGRPMWYDKNGDITYTPAASDRRVIGTTRPRHTGGLDNTFTFKGLDLNFLFQFQYGRKESDAQANFLSETGNRSFNTLRELADRRWMQPGQITDVPRAYNGGVERQGSNHIIASTRTFQKTDYIRLRNIQLGYTIPQNLASKVKMNSARVYVQGTNLYTYSDWLGYDPEFFGNAAGIIPQPKNVTFGVQLGF